MSLEHITLSAKEIRKLVLLSQGLPQFSTKGSAKGITLDVIKHLGYIQIDTISVIERAHHHVLWSRNPRYRQSQLDQLIAEGEVFEYWSHAASFLPMCDFRYSIPRKESILKGEQNHWFRREEKMESYVLDRIRSEGPLMAKDFEHTTGEKIGVWGSKPAKQALENLFMQGDLMISSRRNFHKVYDLTDKVLPSWVDRSTPTDREYAQFLIKSYLRANGVGQLSEILYLKRGDKNFYKNILNEMVEDNSLISILYKNREYYALSETLELLNRKYYKSKLKILSPFDNLLIQRKRMVDLFGFDYQLECYVPANKRVYGYFSLPILWDGRLVARVDCKADRKKSELIINNFHFESSFKKREIFLDAYNKSMNDFLRFNNCRKISD